MLVYLQLLSIITHKDKSIRIAEFHTSFFKDGLIIQMVDITEREQVEKELQKLISKHVKVEGFEIQLLNISGKS